MMTPTLRLATPDDADALARLKLSTFRETFVDGGFAVPYPPADLAVFVAEAYSREKVASELNDSDHATWLAETGGDLIGYAHVGPTKLPHPEADARHGELYQLYLRGPAQGLKLGGKLLTLALDHLASTRPGPAWLGVWSGNERAQAFYAGRGFEKVGAYQFPVGAWLDEEFIMRKA